MATKRPAKRVASPAKPGSASARPKSSPRKALVVAIEIQGIRQIRVVVGSQGIVVPNVPHPPRPFKLMIEGIGVITYK